MIRKYVNLRIFSILKIGLQTKLTFSVSAFNTGTMNPLFIKKGKRQMRDKSIAYYLASECREKTLMQDRAEQSKFCSFLLKILQNWVNSKEVMSFVIKFQNLWSCLICHNLVFFAMLFICKDTLLTLVNIMRRIRKHLQH